MRIFATPFTLSLVSIVNDAFYDPLIALKALRYIIHNLNSHFQRSFARNGYSVHAIITTTTSSAGLTESLRFQISTLIRKVSGIQE
jgi:hypothetical protein